MSEKTFTIQTNINDTLRFQINALQFIEIRISSIAPGTYNTQQLLTAVQTAISNDAWDASHKNLQYYDELTAKHTNSQWLTMTHNSSTHMITFQRDGNSAHRFYFVHGSNDFTHCEFFKNCVGLFSSSNYIVNNPATLVSSNDSSLLKDSRTYPDSTYNCILNHTSSSINLSLSSTTISIEPLGYYIIPDSLTFVHHVCTNALVLNCNDIRNYSITDPTHVFNIVDSNKFHLGVDTFYTKNEKAYDSSANIFNINFINVDSPINILDNNVAKQIYIPYGLYSYHWFWKFLTQCYDQIKFRELSETRTVIWYSATQSIDYVCNGFNDTNPNIKFNNFDSYFALTDSNIWLTDSSEYLIIQDQTHHYNFFTKIPVNMEASEYYLSGIIKAGTESEYPFNRVETSYGSIQNCIKFIDNMQSKKCYTYNNAGEIQWYTDEFNNAMFVLSSIDLGISIKNTTNNSEYQYYFNGKTNDMYIPELHGLVRYTDSTPMFNRCSTLGNNINCYFFEPMIQWVIYNSDTTAELSIDGMNYNINSMSCTFAELDSLLSPTTSIQVEQTVYNNDAVYTSQTLSKPIDTLKLIIPYSESVTYNTSFNCSTNVINNSKALESRLIYIYKGNCNVCIKTVDSKILVTSLRFGLYSMSTLIDMMSDCLQKSLNMKVKYNHSIITFECDTQFKLIDCPCSFKDSYLIKSIWPSEYASILYIYTYYNDQISQLQLFTNSLNPCIGLSEIFSDTRVEKMNDNNPAMYSTYIRYTWIQPVIVNKYTTDSGVKTTVNMADATITGNNENNVLEFDNNVVYMGILKIDHVPVNNKTYFYFVNAHGWSNDTMLFEYSSSIVMNIATDQIVTVSNIFFTKSTLHGHLSLTSLDLWLDTCYYVPKNQDLSIRTLNIDLTLIRLDGNIPKSVVEFNTENVEPMITYTNTQQFGQSNYMYKYMYCSSTSEIENTSSLQFSVVPELNISHTRYNSYSNYDNFNNLQSITLQPGLYIVSNEQICDGSNATTTTYIHFGNQDFVWYYYRNAYTTAFETILPCVLPESQTCKISYDIPYVSAINCYFMSTCVQSISTKVGINNPVNYSKENSTFNFDQYQDILTQQLVTDFLFIEYIFETPYTIVQDSNVLIQDIPGASIRMFTNRKDIFDLRPDEFSIILKRNINYYAYKYGCICYTNFKTQGVLAWDQSSINLGYPIGAIGIGFFDGYQLFRTYGVRYSFSIIRNQYFSTVYNPLTGFRIAYTKKCSNPNIEVYPYPTVRYGAVALFFYSFDKLD